MNELKAHDFLDITGQLADSDVDLSKYDMQELETMKSNINQLFSKMNEAIAYKIRQEKEKALAAINQIAKEHNIDIDSIPSLIGNKPKADVKFRDPSNPANTWTGLGRKPKWLHSAIEQGQLLEDFEIKKS